MLRPRPSSRASARRPERCRVHEERTPDICRRGEMAETSQRQEPQVYEDPSGWAGWVVFGGVILILIGMAQGGRAFVALVTEAHTLARRAGLALTLASRPGAGRTWCS